jgi:RNA recognition motif-containing protein
MANARQSKTLTVRLPDGCEVVLTLIQSPGVEASAFEAYVRQAQSALEQFQTIEPAPFAEPEPAEMIESAESAESAEPGEQAAAAAAAPVIPPSDRKLYVGNLPFAWTEDPLRELFASAGTVTNAAIARFGRRGRSRGFGFVEMSTAAEAQTAIEKLHDGLAGDRKMVVRLSHSKEGRPERSSAPAPETEAPIRRPASRGGRGGRRQAPKQSRPQRAPSSRPERGSRPQRATGISNSSGYEIYPRDSKGGFSSEPTSRSAAPPPSSIEPSPYMEDTGDIENRPPRSPRRRRR